VLSIPVAGFVNALSLSNSGRILVAGIGQEHRLGRWTTNKQARNGLNIIRLPIQAEEERAPLPRVTAPSNFE